MTPQQDIEMAIRTAQLFKSLSQLINIGSASTAKLVMAEATGHFVDLAKFVDKCSSGKGDGAK